MLFNLFGIILLQCYSVTYWTISGHVLQGRPSPQCIVSLPSENLVSARQLLFQPTLCVMKCQQATRLLLLYDQIHFQGCKMYRYYVAGSACCRALDMLQTGVQLDASYRALSQHRHQEANTRTRTAQQVEPQDILNAHRAARLREPASMRSAIKRNVSKLPACS